MNVYKIVLDKFENGCETRKTHFVIAPRFDDVINEIKKLYSKMNNTVIKDFILVERIASDVINTY